ncbi:sensor histidine kinase [Nitrincola alkalilacustris]|uniref:sensor histidine kinase n=1 Tax=Nitrincola alkalilacustris TaxID=1571224 RepID=UPI00124D043D|nr:ATP-binding protein [Nitrincola alkalilacustris]
MRPERYWQALSGIDMTIQQNRSVITSMDDFSRTWRPLRIFNAYRLFLAALFVFLIHFGFQQAPLASTSEQLFSQASLAYLIFGFAAIVPLWLRWPRYLLQVSAHIGADILIIVVLMHASGGVGSGVGMLLVVSIAIVSTMVTGRQSGFFAAVATLAVLAEQLYSALVGLDHHINYPLAGMLGLALFATAIMAHVLASRATASEALARQRGLDLADMAQLTDYIIEQMEVGVMVVDPDGQVRFINNAAWRLSGEPRLPKHAELEDYSEELSQELQRWKSMKREGRQRFLINTGRRKLLINLVAMDKGQESPTLIFLEEADATSREAQQLKLAALGRLTGSIAHEIRNPLGAISHAGALLAESPVLDAADKRLTQIISEQSKRVNSIVESILQLGKRDKTQPELISLHHWLSHFLRDYYYTRSEARDRILLEPVPEDMQVWFDPIHLNQIISNLCDNALRFSKPLAGQAEVRLRCAWFGGKHGYIDVIDTGPGVAKVHLDQLFEPFFTTDGRGVGLGLYLCRELAEFNLAQLRYIGEEDEGGHFRLLFPAQQIDRNQE